MSESTAEHRQTSPAQARVAVITVSDTRTLDNDTGGASVCQLAIQAGHQVVARVIVKDEPAEILSQLELLQAHGPDAILITGGTGLSSRDQTYETIDALLDKRLPGYGELFRMLSYAEIGAAAMLSRAVAGIWRKQAIFTMPGSPAGARLAMEKLILPELGHVLREAKR